MGARHFGPDTNRFLQQDLLEGALGDLGLAADPLTGNRYALAGGNPVSYVEWDGHMIIDGGGTASSGGGSCISPQPTSSATPSGGGSDLEVVTSTVAQKATGLAGGLSHLATIPLRVARAGIQGGLPGAARQGVAEFKGLVTGAVGTVKENAETGLRTYPLTGMAILAYETQTKGPVVARRNALRAGTSAAFDITVGAATYGATRAVGAAARVGEVGAETTTTQAAEAGARAIEAPTRIAPWAGHTLSRVAQTDEVMYRVWGGGSGRVGEWLTPIRPESSAAARAGLGLPEENAATYVSRVVVPAGTRIQVGQAGRAFGQPGGWTQVQLLERIPPEYFGKGVLLGP